MRTYLLLAGVCVAPVEIIAHVQKAASRPHALPMRSYSQGHLSHYKDTYSIMFTFNAVTVAKRCPSTVEWIVKTHSTYTKWNIILL